jgi:hypothetical protein
MKSNEQMYWEWLNKWAKIHAFHIPHYKMILLLIRNSCCGIKHRKNDATLPQVYDCFFLPFLALLLVLYPCLSMTVFTHHFLCPFTVYHLCRQSCVCLYYLLMVMMCPWTTLHKYMMFFCWAILQIMARPQVEALSYGHMGSAVDWTLVLNIVFVLLQIHNVLVFSYTPDNGETAGRAFIWWTLAFLPKMWRPQSLTWHAWGCNHNEKSLLIMARPQVVSLSH